MNAFMTLAGPVEDPARVIDLVMMSAFASDYSQSNAFLGYISSFQYIVQNANNNFNTMGTALEGMFKELYGRYFPMVNLTVTPRILETDTAKIAIRLSGTVTTGSGQQLDLAGQLISANGQVIQMLSGDRVIWQA